MLRRIYIDNYKCFVNFEWKPEAMNLLLGGNGSGKSTVFEVLAKIRSIVVDDARVSEVFPVSSLTAWDTRTTQRFELEWVVGKMVTFTYVLELEHDRESRTSRIRSERLSASGAVAYEHDGTNVTVPGDLTRSPVTFAFSPFRSYLGSVEMPPPGATAWDEPSASFPPLSGGWMLSWKAMLFTMQVHKLDVARLDGALGDKADELRPDGRNFASWYSRSLQERPDLIPPLQQDLSALVEGLRALRIVPASQGGRHLVATLGAGNGERPSTAYDLPFSELSEGQRALIVLYAILRFRSWGVFCFDEPDNFVALPEIQPWLAELSASVDKGHSQAFVISHHPEVIDYLAPTSAVVFERPNGGPARIRPLSVDRALGLKASEIIARGWHDVA